MGKQSFTTPSGTIRIGSLIHVDHVHCETSVTKAFPDGIDHGAMALAGKTGKVTRINEAPGCQQIYGTFGQLPLLSDVDRFSIIQY